MIYQVQETPTGKKKSQGWVLSIDQATNAAGVSLWKNGQLIDTICLKSASSSDSYSRRLQGMLPQLDAFLDRHLHPGETITKILFEGVRSRLVMAAVGGFLMCSRLDCKIHQSASFVESTSWKSYARQHGATGDFALIKGCRSLAETGFPVHELRIDSDDIADSILFYHTWYYEV